MIYLDHAATTPLLPNARAKMLEVFDNWAIGQYSNAGGVYQSGNSSNMYLSQLRNQLKELTGADYMIFTASATEANNMVINHARNVVTTKYEHPSIKNHPKVVMVAPENVEKELAKEPCVLSVSGIQHETGLMRDIQALYQMCKKYNCKLHIDAAQMKEFSLEHADFMTISSHKLGGPIGVGALLSKELIKPIIFGGNQEDNMRAGTQALPLIAGFVEAVLESKAQVKHLKQIVHDMIAPEHLLETYAPHEKWCDYIVCLVSHLPGSQIAAFMDINGIAVATGSACTSGALEEITMLERFSNIPENMRHGIRISFGMGANGMGTKECEVKEFCARYNRVVK